MEPTVKDYLVQVENKYQAGLQIQEGEKILLAKALQNSEARTQNSE
jgi:hypothetical protein